RLTRYHLTLRPRLAWLGHRTNQRIFQHLTVPEIVAQVLSEHGILDGSGQRFQLGAIYPKRDYCVQYDETDLHFIQRLCEEDYDYPGRFTERGRGKHLSQRALERHRSDHQLAEGESDQPLLRTGHFLNLGEHPRSDWNQLWLLNEIHHEGKQPQVLEESITNFLGGQPP
ncbi:contractile injection system protein, VgrG/Pvc8 family, partial [Pseudomonas sp. GOM6]|uniref:contractile injection system protein, VgrG/Pvc8 family n=1 Tax=Pseudomonas sp. GOM6 TaxID=3036944 RepID=UPI00240A4AA1